MSEPSGWLFVRRNPHKRFGDVASDVEIKDPDTGELLLTVTLHAIHNSGAATIGFKGHAKRYLIGRVDRDENSPLPNG